jgi:hypothetical protein
LLLGSVASGVVNYAHCPVMVVKWILTLNVVFWHNAFRIALLLIGSKQYPSDDCIATLWPEIEGSVVMGGEE